MLRDAGIESPRVTRHDGEARFPSIRSWMHTDVRGWSLSERLDDAQFERLAEAGFDAFLVGEALMRAEDPGTALAGLLGGVTKGASS